MSTMIMKNWFHDHVRMNEKVSRMVHDDRFLPILIAAVLLAIFISLLIWGNFNLPKGSLPPRPYAWPYTY